VFFRIYIHIFVYFKEISVINTSSPPYIFRAESTINMSMNALVIEEYGGINNIVHKKVPKPEQPTDHDVLIS